MTEERVELKPHPIRDLVAQALKDGSEEPALFDQHAEKVVSDAVTVYVQKQDRELHEVVRTLIAVYEWLRDEQRSPTAAEALKSTFKRPDVIERIHQIEAEMKAEEHEARSFEAEKNAEAFGKMAGRDAKTAPQLGDTTTPEGAVKLGNLNFPKKL